MSHQPAHGSTRPDPDTPFAPDLQLDRTSPVPLYHQIAQPLEELITSGSLEPGRLIEDEVSMANRLQVSRPTARRALQDLVTRGLLNRRRGAGTRVTPSHVHRPLGLTSLNDDLVKAGFEPRTEVLSFEVKFADDEEAAHLGCAAGTEIARIRRRRWIDDRSLALLTNILPAAIAPNLTELSSTGLYACLEERGIRPATAKQSVGARNADEEDADKLSLQVGAALLTMERTAYDSEGNVIEFGSHVYNAGLYSFTFSLFAE
ncbi:GntR family transcriptional regulator [Propionicicella superfundia]|uniref:GntR family transcriptional regulator n=1 Tax=Propionicicella superfundia TaxID=348582 RepID=UPI00041CBE9B|nr:GntR family transcriptional regulator [Propionicicella superfundia]